MTLIITGPIKSGKNHMMIDPRSGRHYPNRGFKEWRDSAMKQILGQVPRGFRTINYQCQISFSYTPADKRKRDMPGMCDAIFHVLERVGIISDDCLFVKVAWNPVIGTPGVCIEIETFDSKLHVH